jgi:large subunit ribosomal protein L7/L12
MLTSWAAELKPLLINNDIGADFIVRIPINFIGILFRRNHMSVDSIIAEIEKLNVLELVELTKTLQDKWGVSAAPVAAAAAPVAAAEAAAPVEEKTEFDAILTEVDASKKINVIKVVRELTGLGLKEAKAVVDEAPKPVKEGVSKEEAEKIAAKLTEAGGKVTIK